MSCINTIGQSLLIYWFTILTEIEKRALAIDNIDFSKFFAHILIFILQSIFKWFSMTQIHCQTCVYFELPTISKSLMNSTCWWQNLFARAETGHIKVDELQQQQSLTDESSSESASNSGLGKNLVPEDELKASYPLDTSVCGRFLLCSVIGGNLFLSCQIQI